MKLLSLFVTSMAVSFLISGCTAKKSESALLSDRKACTEEDCPSPQSSISGDFIISPDAGAYQMNVDKSDIIEIAGKCSDLGFRANKILVEVYEGEDTSIPAGPYINNATSFNCINSTTTSPVINGQRCIWITDGKGAVVTDISGNPILEFPQCYNGKFSFSVRLGKILRENMNPGYTSDDSANPRKKYLVRFKLRVDDPIRESAWNSAVVERGITKPTFSQTTNLSNASCKININAFKNLSSLGDISYSAYLVREYINNQSTGLEYLFPYLTLRPGAPVGVPGLGMQFFLDYASIDGWGVREFDIANKNHLPITEPPYIIPGVRHKISVTAYDRKYTYTAMSPLSPPTSLIGSATEESTEEFECDFRPPVLNFDGGGDIDMDSASSGSSENNSRKFCQVSVSDFPNLDNNAKLQFMVIKNKTNYVADFEPAAVLPLCFNFASSIVEGCYRNKDILSSSSDFDNFRFTPEEYPKNTYTSNADNTYNGSYGIAARYVTSDFSKKGAWSNTIVCTFSQ